MLYTDIEDVAMQLYGADPSAMQRLAGALGVNTATLKRVMAGKHPMPPGWGREMDDLLAAKHASSIAAPQDGFDRDDQAADAIDPHLHLLQARVVDAGWRPDEFLHTVADWTFFQIVDNYGYEATRELLLRLADELHSMREEGVSHET